MAITIATFVNATSAKYTAGNLNPRRQRLFRMLGKAADVKDIASGLDYVTTDALAKALITDSAIVTKGMTDDQVRAGVIYSWANGPSIVSFPTFSDALSRIRFWQELDDHTLDKMEMILDYYATTQS